MSKLTSTQKNQIPLEKPPQLEKKMVLLHGWGCDSRTWQPLIPLLPQDWTITTIDLPGFGINPPLQEFSLDALLDNIWQQLPSSCVLVGWSLGGVLAVELAARYPQQIEAVITLASNLKFVASSDYPAAMPRWINEEFNREFATQPQKTLLHFVGLITQGDNEARQLLRTLRTQDAHCLLPQYMTGTQCTNATTSWHATLELLAQIDNRKIFSQLIQPGLHLFAEKDVLVPVASSKLIQSVNPLHASKIIKGAAHALHWSQPQKIADEVTRFLASLAKIKSSSLLASSDSKELDKKKVAQSFSRAAHSYDAVAQLQRYVGDQLMHELPAQLPAGAKILDLGSGTGAFTEKLQQCYSGAQIYGLDIAEGMLQFARKENLPSLHWVCGDAEQLPLAAESFDLIFSSLTLQWCNQLPLILNEIKRVLKSGGHFYFSTLGPDTLHELKSAWQAVDNHVHVNAFTSLDSVLADVDNSGLVLNEFQEEIRTLHFDQVSDLTKELKLLGAQNMNPGQSKGLTTRNTISRFKQAYEQYRKTDGVPATYHIFYIEVHKRRSI
jgi:malonyl-CoA O-methyltransferase